MFQSNFFLGLETGNTVNKKWLSLFSRVIDYNCFHSLSVVLVSPHGIFSLHNGIQEHTKTQSAYDYDDDDDDDDDDGDDDSDDKLKLKHSFVIKRKMGNLKMQSHLLHKR